MPHAPRSQHTVSPRVHSIILSVVLVPSRSLSPSFSSLCRSRKSARRLSGAHTHTHARRGKPVRSLSFPHWPVSRAPLGCLVPVATTERSRAINSATRSARALTSSFLLFGSASPSPHCHESMRRAEGTTKPLCVLAAGQPTSPTEIPQRRENSRRTLRLIARLPGARPRSRPVSRRPEVARTRSTPDISALCVPIDPQAHATRSRFTRATRASKKATTTLITQRRTRLALSLSLLPPPALPVPPPPRFSHSREKTTRHHCAILPLSRAMPLRRSPPRRRRALYPRTRIAAIAVGPADWPSRPPFCLTDGV